jgi:hypothetical protein
VPIIFSYAWSGSVGELCPDRSDCVGALARFWRGLCHDKPTYYTSATDIMAWKRNVLTLRRLPEKAAVSASWQPVSMPLPYGPHGPSVPSSRKHGVVSYGETDSTISKIIFHYAIMSFYPPAGVACVGNHVLRLGTGSLGARARGGLHKVARVDFIARPIA